nr:ABC transporter ATP-binding protein [uncultured Cohaesibacter sp.]
MIDTPKGASAGSQDNEESRDHNRGVRLANLSHKIDAKPFFKDFSVHLTERRIGLIGRNGSGKSTLSRLICGLVKPDAGEILVNGVNVYEDRAAAIRTIGLIFQNPDHQIIFPTVEEEVAFGLESLLGDKKQARLKAREFLERFGRADWAERGTYTLSQGQRHLVCLMSVLAMEPGVILLDEPFAGLDLPTTRRLFRWLDGLEQQLLMVTHDIEHLAGFDRVLWLEQGRIVADGTPDAVLPAYLEAMDALVEFDDQLPEHVFAGSERIEGLADGEGA